MNARITIQALALLLVLVVVAGDANGQYSLSYMKEIAAEEAQPEGKWGQGVTLFAEVPAQPWSSVSVYDRLIDSYCVAQEWQAEFQQESYDVWSSCGDSTHDAKYVFEYASADPRAQWGMYFLSMPLEVAIGEEIGIAEGTRVIALNSVSILGDVTTSQFIPLSNQDAFRKVLLHTEEEVDTSNSRVVLWVNTAFRDTYYTYVENVSESAFLAGSEECRGWDREATSLIEKLYDKGVVIVAGAGLRSGESMGLQRYPACLEEVISVTTYETGERLHGFSDLSHGATIAAPTGVIYQETVVHSPSFAVARVVGAVLRILEVNSGLTPREVRQLLENTGRSVGNHLGFEASLLQVDSAATVAAKLVSSEEEFELPEQRVTLELYPNPYTGGLLHIVDVSIAEWEHQEVEVFDLLGRRVKILKDREVSLDDLSPGRYFVRSTMTGTTKILTIVK